MLRHWSAFFGRAVFCVAFGFVAASSAGAAPLCSAVLLNAFSEGQISATILNIADLKMQMDLSQAHGKRDKDPATKLLAKDYHAKYRDLIKQLSGRYSESELKVMISKKIHELQSRSQKSEQDERKTRAKQSEVITKPHVPHYVFEKRITPPGALNPVSFSAAKNFHYIEKWNVFLVEVNNEIVLFDPVAGEMYEIGLVKTDHVKVSDDQSKIYLLEKDGSVSTFDLSTRTLQKIAQNDDMAQSESMDVDPSGQFMVANPLSGDAHVFELATGNVQIYKHLNSNIGNWNRDSTFLDADRLISNKLGTLSVFNRSLNKGEDFTGVSKFILSKDRKQVLIDFADHLAFYWTTDLTTPLGAQQWSQPPGGYKKMQFHPDQEHVFIEQNFPDTRLGIYSIYDLSKPLSSIESYQGKFVQSGIVTKIIGFSTSANGRTVYIAVQEVQSGLTYIDKWEDSL
jgi:hypothetical protein